VIRVTGLPGPICAPIPERHYLITAMTSLDLVFSCLIPSVVIVVLNVRIIIKIHRYQNLSFAADGGDRRGNAFTNAGSMTARAAAIVAAAQLNLTDPTAAATATATRRRSLVQTSVSANGSMHIKFTSTMVKPMSARYCVLAVTPPPQRTPPLSGKTIVLDERVKKLVRGQTQYRTARMLLILSSVTVLFNLPTHVFRVHSLVQELFGSSEKASRVKFFWQELFQLLYFSNFAVNFFVYSACGRQFRTGLNRLRERLKLNVNKRVSGLFYMACRRGRRKKNAQKRKARATQRFKEDL